MKKVLLIVFVLCSNLIIAQAKISNICKADISIIQDEFNRNGNKVTDEMRTKFPINKINGLDYVSFLAEVNDEFDNVSLQSEGVKITSRIENIVTLKVPILGIENVLLLNGLSSIQLAGKIHANLNKALVDTRVDLVHEGYWLPESYTGDNVLIGITDWGFDYSSPMFYDTSLVQTRILSAWDQYKNAGPSPMGFDYGTEFNTAEDLIQAGSDTSNIYSYSTHGTHVAGIAGGSGAGTQYRGIAFESQFLFATFYPDEGAVLDAWQWMYNKSVEEDKRLVINMSWGLYWTGALDGTGILSQALDGYSSLGVLFVTSGGNNGDWNFHIQKDFSGDELLSRIGFYFGPQATLWGQSIHAWGNPGMEFSAGLYVLNSSDEIVGESPLHSTATTNQYFESTVIVDTDTIFYNMVMDAAYPTNSRPHMRFRIKSPPSAYKIVLRATAEDGEVHFWNVTELTNDVGNWGQPFSAIGAGYSAGDDGYGIGMPACTNTAISVASYASSYVTNNGTPLGGQLSTFSSMGPIITGDLKPDIAAPGQSVASSISSYTDASYIPITNVEFNGRSYPFARFSGTSMASPMVAGIAALVLDANPTLTPAQLKSILLETAREDSHTGVIPPTGDYQWGMGKVDAYAAIQEALGITGLTEFESSIPWTIYPNPTSDVLNVRDLEGKVEYMQIIDLNGSLVDFALITDQLQLNTLSSGTYFLRIVRNGKVEQRKFIVN